MRGSKCLSLVGALLIASGASVARGQSAASVLRAPANDLTLAVKAPPRAQTVAVLILSGGEAGVPLSELYASARNSIEKHTAVTVAPLDAIRLELRATALRECAGEAACFARRVSGNEINLLLTVSVDRIDEQGGLLLGLRLIDIETESQIGATGDEIPFGMSVRGAMEQQLPLVFPKSVWDQIGALELTTTPEMAEVLIAGRSCVSPCSLERLVPGTYEATIRKAGYLEWKGPVTVEAGRTNRLEQVLAEPEGGIVTSPWLWTGVGVAAIGVGLAAFFLTRSDVVPVNICVGDDIADCGG